MTADPDEVGLSRARWHAVSRIPTYQKVVQQIEEQIVLGALRSGQRLPPERDLAAHLEVSRPAIREGLRILEAQGVLSIGVGTGPDSGAIVRALPSQALTHLLRVHVALTSFPHESLVDTRTMLERWSVELAVEKASNDQLDDLEKLVDKMDDPALSLYDFNELDTQFHAGLAEAAGNPLVTAMTSAIRNAVRQTILRAFTRSDDWPALANRLRKEHRAILEAVRNHDPVRASNLISQHISGFYATLQPES